MKAHYNIRKSSSSGCRYLFYSQFCPCVHHNLPLIQGLITSSSKAYTKLALGCHKWWSLFTLQNGKIINPESMSMECFSLLTFSLALSWSNISWISCFQSSCKEWKESLGISKKPDSSMAVRWSRILAKEGRECGSGFQQSRIGQRQATVKHLLAWRFERMSSTLLIPSG